MSNFFNKTDDGNLGNASNGYPVYDPFSFNNNPSWVSPEFGGGGGGGGGVFWNNPPDADVGGGSPIPPADPTLNPDLPQIPLQTATGTATARTPAPATTAPAAFDNNTVLIGLGVIGVALILLKGK